MKTVIWPVLCRHVWIAVLALVVGLPEIAQSQDSDDPAWQTDLSVTYLTGDYGTDSTTDILYVPFKVSRIFAKGDISLTVPYISLSGDGRVTLVGGNPNRIAKERGEAPATPGPSTPGPPTDQTEGPGVTEGGLGDILLKGRYYALDEAGLLPTVALIGQIKFPTADEDRGLGTGEFDQTLGVEISKYVTDDLLGYVDAGYTFIGEPSEVDLRNQWYYALGLGYYFTDRVLGSVFYEEWRALRSNLSNPRDVFLSLQYRATSFLHLNGGVLAGLSNGAPDAGFLGGVTATF